MLYLTWLGQAGYLLETPEIRIAIDPYLSNLLENRKGPKRLVPPPVLPCQLEAELILCTHDHIDHLDDETICNISAKDICYAGPASCGLHFRKLGIPEEKITPLDRGGEIQQGNVKFYGVHAEHTQDSIGVIMKWKENTLYFVGDSLAHEKLLENKKFKPEVLFCCINGKWGNMDYLHAAELAKELGVRTAVPCHYGMFKANTEDPEKFKQALENSPVSYFELKIGMKYSMEDLLKAD